MEKKIGKYKIREKSQEKFEFFEQYVAIDENGEDLTMFLFHQREELNKNNIQLLSLLEK